MASRFWVGGSGTWDGTSTTNWSATSGGSSGASVPTSADTVTIDSNSGSPTITLGANTATAPITFTASATLTSAGFTVAGNITANGSTATLTLGDALICSGVVTLTSGTLNTNSKTVTCSKFSSSNSNARTLTVTNSTVNITSGGNNVWDCSTSTNLTVNATGSTIVLPSGGFASFQGGSSSLHWNNVTVPFGSVLGSASYDGTVSIGTANTSNTALQGTTFTNLTVTTTDANLCDFLYVKSDFTVTGTLTLTGGSACPNRLVLWSDVTGTRRTITNTGATMVWSNVNFGDIGLSSSYDASAISGGCGDMGNNSNITFTPAKTLYWYQNGGSWSDSSKWFTGTNGVNSNGSSRFPLPQDTAIFDANSFSTTGQTITLPSATMAGAIDFTGVNRTATTFNIGNILYACGSLTATSLVTVNNSGYVQFPGSAAKTLAIPAGGIRHLASFGTGTVTLASSLSATDIAVLNFNAAGYAVTASNGVSFYSAAFSHTVTLGSGTWTLTGTGTQWDATNKTNLTLDTTGSTIILSDTSSTAKTFNGNGLTYNNLQIAGGGTGAVTISGSNTFNTLSVTSGPKTVTLTAGTTQTITALSATGSSGNLITLQSSSTSNATLSKSSGTITGCDYLSLTHVATAGIPASSWYAGANSVDGGGETAWWTFASPVLTATFNAVMSTMSAAVNMLTSHNMSASTSAMSASVTKQAGKTLSASTSPFSGSMTRSITKGIVAATSQFTGSIVKSTTKKLSAQMSSMSASLSSLKAILVVLAAQMSAFSASLLKRTNHTVTATMSSFTGTLSKQTTKQLTASMAAFSGGISKGISKVFNAVSSAFGVVFTAAVPAVWRPLRNRFVRVPTDNRWITIKRDGRREKP